MVTRTATSHGLILLYHYVSDHVPASTGRTLHATTPKMLRENVCDLQPDWKFVSLERFVASEDRSGLAAVTFDDGYRCVIEEAMPVLASMDIPFTLFLNPSVLAGNWNWRDKIRFVISSGLERKFLDFHPVDGPRGDLYRDSKHHSVNSAAVDHALDEFLAETIPDVYGGFPYAGKSELPGNHPLVTYGNHSFNHYVLSSLSPEQQENEIRLAGAAIAETGLPVVNNIFSVPFGGDDDFDESTVRVAGELGYDHLIMSRQRLNPGPVADSPGVLERFMPRSGDILHEIGQIQTGL